MRATDWKRWAAAVMLASASAACSGGPGAGSAGGGGSGNPACPGGTYTADAQGAPMTAHVSLEVLTNVTYVSGDIRGSSAYYTFRGEAWNGTGWVDVVDHGTNSRFRAQVDAAGDGFIFTANAYESGGSTAYQFRCAK